MSKDETPNNGFVPWRERAFTPVNITSEILGVSPASVYALQAQGSLEFFRIAGRTLVSVESLKRVVDNAEPWVASDRGKEARDATGRAKQLDY